MWDSRESEEPGVGTIVHEETNTSVFILHFRFILFFMLHGVNTIKEPHISPHFINKLCILKPLNKKYLF